MTDKAMQQQKADEAVRAAEKARRAGNEATARFFDKVAKAHRQLASG